ncbi:MAG: hypothetical protein M3P40_12455 [Actinomycetota bacterium]|nr:hypothetical protein [Actinomycetota bacterium]
MSEVDEAGNSPLPPPELAPLPTGEVVAVGETASDDRRVDELGTDNPEEQQDAPIQERGV